MQKRTYKVNEVFYSIQGEGARAGSANVFVRFAGCNLECDVEPGPKSPGGFACDTEFASGRALTTSELLDWIKKVGGACRWLILTGGEPGLQADEALVGDLHSAGYKVAVETNGSVAVPSSIDWITVSPKVAEHTIKLSTADEIKYVRRWGQGVPRPKCKAVHQYLSPAFDGNNINQENLQWCIELVKANPTWKLSTQQHKNWTVQ